MGYYIETDSSRNKANWIESNLNAVQCLNASTAKATASKDNIPVCVVDNGFFEAAAIIYSRREFDSVNRSDDYRPKTWLLVPVAELVGKNYIDPSVLDW